MAGRIERESLVDHLKDQPGYRMRGRRLLRPDGTVAARYNDRDQWEAFPTDYEMSDYALHTGKGRPSALLDRTDLPITL